MRLRVIVLLVLAAIALYLAFWPVPVDPVAWDAPVSAGFTGLFVPNERLRGLELLPIGGDHGPETIAVDRKGQVYTGTKEGRILRDGRAWVSTRGRPLGMTFDYDGNLLVADALRGLLQVAPDGRVTTLVRDIAYPNSVAVSPMGDVYFTDSSARFSPRIWNGSYEASLLDILEHGGHGRVRVYDPLTNETRTLIAGLNFPNGVAVSPDGAFVLIAETGSYRVLRHWLEGPKQGRTEPLLANLPGFPDNITTGLDGRFWIGLVSPRNGLLDRLSRWPRLRKAVQRLPKLIRPKAVAYGHIVAIDGNGRVLVSLQDPEGRYRLTTGAAETEQYLYVSSLEMPAVGRMRAPVVSRVKRVPIEFRDRWIRGTLSYVPVETAESQPLMVSLEVASAHDALRELRLSQISPAPCFRIRVLYRASPSAPARFVQSAHFHQPALWSTAPLVCFHTGVQWSWRFVLLSEKPSRGPTNDDVVVHATMEPRSATEQIAIVLLRQPENGTDVRAWTEHYERLIVAQSDWVGVGE